MLLLVAAVVVELLVQMHMVLVAVVLVRCLLRLERLVHHLQHLMLSLLVLAEVIALTSAVRGGTGVQSSVAFPGGTKYGNGGGGGGSNLLGGFAWRKCWI